MTKIERFWMLTAVVAALGMVAVGCGDDDDGSSGDDDDDMVDSGVDMMDGGVVSCGEVAMCPSDSVSVGPNELPLPGCCLDEATSTCGTNVMLIAGIIGINPEADQCLAQQVPGVPTLYIDLATACEEDEDCDDGVTCTEGFCERTACETNEDCTEGVMICAPDGACADPDFIPDDAANDPAVNCADEDEGCCAPLQLRIITDDVWLPGCCAGDGQCGYFGDFSSLGAPNFGCQAFDLFTAGEGPKSCNFGPGDG